MFLTLGFLCDTSGLIQAFCRWAQDSREQYEEKSHAMKKSVCDTPRPGVFEDFS